MVLLREARYFPVIIEGPGKLYVHCWMEPSVLRVDILRILEH